MDKKIISIIIIVLFFLLPGCIDNGNDEEKDRWFKIDIKIESSTSNNYEIYLPIPVNGYANWVVENEGVPIDSLNNLKLIEGNGIFEIVEKENEHFLYINSNDLTQLQLDEEYISGKKMPSPFDSLSSNKTFVNSTSDSDIMINYFIEYYIEDSKKFTWELHNYHAIIGWQEIDIKEELMIID